MDKLEPKSKDILKENVEKIKKLFPEVFSEDKVDFEKLKEVLGEFREDKAERYSFNWNGKAQAKRIAQTPTSATLKPNKKESKDWDKTQNLYIEGDNLEVLKILQTPYYGKVKMIYIDPPYNTGKDFVYKDNFKDNLKNYLKQTGQVDEEGNKMSANTEQNGRYHTYWLNMMYPRLQLARNLLKEDGVIFISIDDNEVHNLRKICDEVFGEENFVVNLIWKSKSGGANDSKFFATDHEYLVCYAKDISLYENNLDKDGKVSTSYNYEDGNGRYALDRLDKQSIRYSPSLDYEIVGPDGEKYYPKHKDNNNPNATWRWGKNTVKEKYSELVFKDGNVYTKNYEKEEVIPRSLLIDQRFGRTRTGKTDFYNLFNINIFDNPKPIKLVYFLQCLCLNNNDVVLDFFSGSATTAHATMQLNAEDGGNRKYIMIQLPEKTKEDSEAYKAGYKNICEIGKERIRRAGEKIKKELEEKNKQLKLGEESVDVDKLDFGFKVFKLSESNLESSIIDPNQSEEEIKEKMQASLNVVKHSATEEDLLYEILLKYKIELTEPIIEENVLDKKIYVLGEGLLFICLDEELTKNIGDEIGKLKEKYDPEGEVRVVFRDNGFKTSEEKLNVIHTLKNYGITDVKSI